MATGTLTGQTIANTYKALLKITGTTAGGETLHATTQKVIEDGDGNPFPFSAAQDAILMTGTSRLEFNDNGEYIAGDGNDLTIASGRDILLAATNQVVLGSGIELEFGGAASGEYISGDGTDLTITSGNDIVLSPTGSVGIGLNPSGWDTYGKVLQIGEQFNIMANDDGQDTYITANRYYASGWKWQNTDTGASQIFMSAGVITFSNHAGSGSVGASQTIVDRMSIAAAGDVTVSTGNLIVNTAGKGIMFSPFDAAATGPPGSDSNLLDDYEEGTWTPVIRGNTPAPSGQSYDQQIGRYTKIGRLVMLEFDVLLTAQGTVGGSYLVIGGIPFNPDIDYWWGGTALYFESMGTNCTSVVGTIAKNNDIFIWTTTAAQASLTRTNPATDWIGNDTRLAGAIMFSGTAA